MKILIAGIALFLISMAAIVYQRDFNAVEIGELELKNQIEEAAAGAALYYDPEQYAEGYMVFNDEHSVKIVQSMMGSDSDYILYLFDDSLSYRKYDKAGLVSQKGFSFPHVFKDSTGFKTEIKEPCVIIEAGVSRDLYRLETLQDAKKDIRRSTMYQVEGR